MRYHLYIAINNWGANTYIGTYDTEEEARQESTKYCRYGGRCFILKR